MSHEYLALDPGNSTGWATFNEKGEVGGFGTLRKREEVYEKLEEEQPKVLIVEDWITRQGINLGGTKLEVVRVIGAVECWAYFHQADVHLQPNTIKPIGYKWAGLTKPKNHDMSHETDAYVHGVYWLQKNGIRKPQQGREL